MDAERKTQLQALHGDLQQLNAAIDAEDHALAAAIVLEHDQRLRQYLEYVGPDASLTALLQEQHAVTERMSQLRDHAALQLRQERQSSRAASAYQQAGALG